MRVNIGIGIVVVVGIGIGIVGGGVMHDKLWRA
jgi:hypothetical protein